MMKGTGCSYALHLKWASDLAGQGGTLAGGWVADQETNLHLLPPGFWWRELQ